MSGNKRGFDHLSMDGGPAKRTRTSQGGDIRTIQPLALGVALGNHPTYTPNVPASIPLPTPGPPPTQMPMATSPENLTLDMPSATPAANLSPFGATYHHTGAPHPYTTRYTKFCGLRIGSNPLEHFNIKIPENMSKEAASELKAKWDAELQRQKENPPALPPSQVQQLPPKAHLGEPMPYPADGTPEEQRRVTAWNDWLSKKTQSVDRQRNNQAAKKSRETRIESLNVTRAMLNDTAAERDWLRLKVLQLGGDLEDWDGLDQNSKNRIVEVISVRVKECEVKTIEEKKREEAKKRAERNRVRQEAMRNRPTMPPIPPHPHPHPQAQMQPHQQTQSQQMMSSMQSPGLQSVAEGSPETASFFSPQGGMGMDDGGFLGNMDFLGTP